MGKFRIDSRQVKEGDVFIAIRSGVNYVWSALEQGADYCVVPEGAGFENGDKILVVDDTVNFLGEKAKEARLAFSGGVVGITGSAGKTTLKEMLGFALSSLGYKVGKSWGNYNNAIGLPASILSFDGDEDFWILELATNQVGDIAYLSDIARPDFAFVTSIYPSHLEGLGTVEGVAREKSEIAKYAKIVFAPIRFFFELSPYLPNGKTRFLTGIKGVNFPLKGIQFEDLLALVSAFLETLGHSIEEVDWSGFEGMKGRFSILKFEERIVVNDAYNANPGSMKASLSSFKEMFGDGRDVAIVIGDMLELGQEREKYHKDVVAFVKYLFPEARKVCIGKEMLWAAKSEGLEDALLIEDWPANIEEIKDYLSNTNTLFFKASNGIRLGDLIEQLFGRSTEISDV